MTADKDLTPAPLPAVPATASVAIVAGGCFWGVEDSFSHLPGVLAVTSGYIGGSASAPTYRQVCEGTTNHAEAVRIVFDPARISYVALLDHFWNIHDPTQVNRQGPDVGTQYRSAIFTTSATQASEAAASKKAAQAYFPRPIATTISPAETFWAAEVYHQAYFEKHGQGGCHAPRAGWRVVTEKLHLSDAQWKAKLSPEAFAILRGASTEPRFCAAYVAAKSHGDGHYQCAGCGLELFESKAKFESGTGWPSFFSAIKGRVSERPDTSGGMLRVEITCYRCDGHLGHVFEDGPKPTGRRFCLNGQALTFIPAATAAAAR